MSKKNIYYRNEIRKIYQDNQVKYIRTALPKRESEYIVVKYLVSYADKDGTPCQDSYDELSTAEYKARWCVDHNMFNVQISKMTQQTKIEPMFSYAPADPAPAEGKSERSERVCNVVAPKCKNFALANGDASAQAQQQEFQFGEILF